MESKKMNLTVGQIVYLLTKKSPNPKVYPALVCEEIQKRSLQGKTVNYVIRLPTADRREIEVDNIDAEIFESVEEARDAMFKRAKDSIEEILMSNFVIDHCFNVKTWSKINGIIPEEPRE